MTHILLSMFSICLGIQFDRFCVFFVILVHLQPPLFFSVTFKSVLHDSIWHLDFFLLLDGANDLYCFFHGYFLRDSSFAELISPDDLLQACSLWEKFDVYAPHYIDLECLALCTYRKTSVNVWVGKTIIVLLNL